MMDYLVSVFFIVVLLGGAAAYFFTRPLPKFPTKGEELVYRATSLMNFDFLLLIRIVIKERPQLTAEDIDRILRRYHRHVSFWNIGIETIEAELRRFAAATGLLPNDVLRQFNAITEEKAG